MKMRNPLVVHQFTLQRGISFVITPTMGTQEDPGIENFKTDLLVLTLMAGAKLSHGMLKIDAKQAGIVSAALQEQNFSGEAGQSLLLDFPSDQNGPKHVLIVGLGNPAHFNGRVVCALMRKVLETAKELGVEKLTLPIFPNRQTESAINLAGSVATLVCRVKMFVDELPKLKEVELFCTPQAKRHIQDGLFGHTPRCIICVNPELIKNPK